MHDEARSTLYHIIGLVREASSDSINTKSMEGFCIYMLQRLDAPKFGLVKDAETEEFEERLLTIALSRTDPPVLR